MAETNNSAAERLANVRIVLVGTTHPGNIGGAARAMKVMGLHDLALVAPRYFPHADATAMASGADDLLERVTVHRELADALAGCTQVYGASARLRSVTVPAGTPRMLCEQTAAMPSDAKVAFVFGREKSGLDNAELDLCHKLLHIDANPAYSSLNLAQAVQVVCYEMRCAALEAAVAGAGAAEDDARRPAEHDVLEHLFGHLQNTLEAVEFLKPAQPRLLMRKLRRLTYRAEPDLEEINILRGILSAVDRKLRE